MEIPMDDDGKRLDRATVEKDNDVIKELEASLLSDQPNGQSDNLAIVESLFGEQEPLEAPEQAHKPRSPGFLRRAGERVLHFFTDKDDVLAVTWRKKSIELLRISEYHPGDELLEDLTRN